MTFGTCRPRPECVTYTPMEPSKNSKAHDSKPTHQPETWRTDMKIENLSKELDTETMTEVKGGIALTGQVVPTNVQSNELLEAFNIPSNGPVGSANDGSQSNYSDQDSFVPVGSLFLTPSLSSLIR